MKYCEFCGKELEKHEKCACEEAQKQSSNTESKEINIKKLCIIGGIIIAIIFVIAFFSSKKIDPFDYTKISFKGYNSMGTVNIKFNSSKIIEEIIGEEPKDIEKIGAWIQKQDSYAGDIDYKCSKSKGLSNGDEVTVSFIVRGELQNHVETKSKTFTVSGLKKAKTVDVLPNINVTFEGVSGEGEVKIEPKENLDKKTREIVESCVFDTDSNYYLKNGDKVEVFISNTDDLLDEFKVVANKSSKTVTVEGLSSFITDKNEIPVELIKDYAVKYLNEKKKSIKDDFLFKYSPVKYYGTYFLQSKDDEYENKLYIFVTYKQYYEGELRDIIYSPLVFYNITIKPDNTLGFDYDDGHNSTFTTDIKESIKNYKEDYTVDSIDLNQYFE